MGDHDRRIAELEMLVMEQERTADQFGELLRDQQRQIEQLTTRLELVESKLSKHAEAADQPIDAFEKPPHY